MEGEKEESPPVPRLPLHTHTLLPAIKALPPRQRADSFWSPGLLFLAVEWGQEPCGTCLRASPVCLPEAPMGLPDAARQRTAECTGELMGWGQPAPLTGVLLEGLAMPGCHISRRSSSRGWGPRKERGFSLGGSTQPLGAGGVSVPPGVPAASAQIPPGGRSRCSDSNCQCLSMGGADAATSQ